MKNFFVILFLLAGIIGPNISSAQTDEQKIYSYDSIDVNIVVNVDSTFSVEEKQLFNYKKGTFHQGWRVIPLNKVSLIDTVVVMDGESGQLLQYSSRRLDKTNPDSWGKYTFFISGGNLNIEWYYDLSNVKHPWILKYTVHGGFEFYKENDRLYWNIFSGYDVPVDRASATAIFPTGIDANKIKFDAYRTSRKVINNRIQAGNQIYFETYAVAPGESFTVDIAFPKGIVKESAFWKEWTLSNYGYLGSAAALLLGAVFLAGYWYYTERYKKGRGIIVAQYEPPQHLRPAMAEVLIKEMITERAWPATVIDLAVRGYVSIEDEMRIKIPLFGYLFSPKGYVIKKKKEYQGDVLLEEYERDFLDMIFSSGDRFSLAEVKRDIQRQRELSLKFRTLKDKLYGETDQDTKAFEKGTSRGKYFASVAGIVVLLLALLGNVGVAYMGRQLHTLALTLTGTVIIIGAFIKFEPRLSKEGYLMKEDWLGFKLYLETAERYRMQNLTPDIFEKYLPYAMIFGIEKKWAKAFETMTMQQPSWYGASPVGMSAGSSSGVPFSPVTFSSSFSSSFMSAFASSSGAGGTGGGGGSAGGGGGGGGGGAS